MAGSRYIPGDNYVADDITGRKTRVSETEKQWDGVRTRRDHWSPRHPQDGVRGLKDSQAAEIIRSEPPPVPVGPRITTVAVAAYPGNICLQVVSNAGMNIGDQISVALDSNDMFITTILTNYEIGYLLTEAGERIVLEDGSGFLIYEDQTANTTFLGLARPLPYGVRAGSVVIDSTASIAPNLL